MSRSLSIAVLLIVFLPFSSSFAANFIVRGDGTVLDQRSGLIWQQGTSGQLPWLEAVRYCNQLELAGSRSWRLPFKDELKSLFLVTGSGEQLDTGIFPELQAEVFWSLSREELQPDQVWGVSFADGRDYLFDRSHFNFQARCMIETPEAVYLPLLNKWCKAWSKQDVDAYLDCYGQQFTPERGISRATWAKQRRERVLRPKALQVEIAYIKVVSEKGGRAEVMFRQTYRSDNYRDQVMKILTLGLERGDLVIVGERTRTILK